MQAMAWVLLLVVFGFHFPSLRALADQGSSARRWVAGAAEGA